MSGSEHHGETVKPYDNGGWLQVGWTEAINRSDEPERVEPAR